MTTNTTDDIPAWIPLCASAGIVGFIAWRITEVDAIAIGAMVLLGIAAVAAMSRGWFVGLQPRDRAAAPAQPIGLVGSRISVGGSVFTVLDDSAVAGDGRRCSVVARDAAGRVELLYVGFDRSGVVCEARVDGGDWAPASVIG